MSASYWFNLLQRNLFRVSRRQRRRVRLPKHHPAITQFSRPLCVTEELEDRTLLTSFFSIDDVSAAEGSSGITELIFTVSRTGTTAGDLFSDASISFQTEDGSATLANNDYLEQSGILYFSADTEATLQTQTITVQLSGDSFTEGNETLHVVLFDNSSGTTISETTGTGTILNDDSNSISINNATAPENHTISFEVSLAEAAGTDISFLVNTITDTADNNDYTFLSNKKITLRAGEVSTRVSIHIHDDEISEQDEQFLLVLSQIQIHNALVPENITFLNDTGVGTIVNDDGLPGSVFSITSEKVIEGDLHFHELLRFTITRSGGTAGDLNFETSVDFETINGTAEAGEDYQSVSKTVTFAASPSATTQTSYVNVYVDGDFQNEDTETVIGRLSNPSDGSYFKGQAAALETTGYITNDDSDFVFQERFSADPSYANHSGDRFGHSVAIDGDILVVSAPGNSLDGLQSGIAYVYQRNNQGTTLDQTDDTWDFQTILQPPIPEAESWFAGSIAIYGNTIVVSAQNDGTGAIYIFTRSGDDWKTDPPVVRRLQVAGLYALARFGTSVDIYENTIVVGARFDTTSGTRSGAVYIFEKEGNDWSSTSQRILLPDNPMYDDFYGSSVAIHSDLIVVGSVYDDDKGYNSGSAYVYSKIGENWTSEAPTTAKLTASDGMARDNFGFSVDTNGTDVIVGSYFGYDKDLNNNGSLYLFSKNGSDWNTEAPVELKLTGTTADPLGRTAALSSNLLVVETRSGKAHIFTRSGSGWIFDPNYETVLTHDGDVSSSLGPKGIGVAISGNTVVFGASNLSTDGSHSGLVYTYDQSPDDQWINKNEIIPNAPSTIHNGLDNFGQSIAVSDDYLVIGAPATDSHLAPTGVVYIYSRNDGGTPDFNDDDTWEYETSLIDPAPEANRDFGTSVQIEGTTIIIEASPTEFPFETEIYIYTRNGSDWKTIPPTVTPLLETVGRTLFNETSIAFQNDTIVVGNPSGLVNDISTVGVVYVYEKYGSDWSTLPPTESVLFASDGEFFDHFGVDVDIDGDLIVAGAEYNQDRGAAYLFQKGNNGWGSASQVKLTASDLKLGSRFGSSVAVENETVIASAATVGDRNSGAIYIFDGSEGWDDPLETIISPATDPRTYYFGKDIDLNGHLLVVNGDTSIPGTSISNGAVYIYDGSDGWENVKETILPQSTQSDTYHRGFGHSAVAILQNQLFIAALHYNSPEISHVYHYQTISSAELHVRVVDSPSIPQPGDFSSSLPANQIVLNEWSSFWVEIWVSLNNTKSNAIQSVDFDFYYRRYWSVTDWTSVSEVEFGDSFSENQTSTIDDQFGVIRNFHAETSEDFVGSEDYILFARVKFESRESDRIDLDLSSRSIGPSSLNFSFGNPQVTLFNETIDLTKPGAVSHTKIYANPYDLNDDDVINYRDLLLFASVYNSIPSQSDSDYAWFADLNQDDRVNFRDLLLFASNYGKSKANGSVVTYPSNFPDAWNQFLVADTSSAPQQTATPLSQTVATKSFSRIVDQVSSSLSEEQNVMLEATTVQVVDLEGDALGRVAGGTIYIDVNAAGYGWYLEGSPAADFNFVHDSDLSLIALPGSDADGRFDLQTVLFHELGHLLGYAHSEDGVMQDTLAPGTRLLPDWELNFEFDPGLSLEDTDDFFLDIQDETELMPFK
ncbi:hypothetical protein FYZ48_16040 [Gimesia chilikensis]|nr:hypothetical protein FYZ48_16040 [Gimesia chilikensis]